MYLETSYCSPWTCCVAQANLRLSVCCPGLTAAAITGVCHHVWLQESHVRKKVTKQSKQMEKASCFNKNQTKPKCGVSGEVGFRAEPVTGQGKRDSKFKET